MNLTAITKFQISHQHVCNTCLKGELNMWGSKNLQLSTKVAVYLWNCTRQAYDYYGLLMGNHRYLTDVCLFQWPWITLKDGTRGACFFPRICVHTLIPFDVERPDPCTLRVVRIGPLRFLAGCRTSQLNQAMSVLSLGLGFFWICVMCC